MCSSLCYLMNATFVRARSLIPSALTVYNSSGDDVCPAFIHQLLEPCNYFQSPVGKVDLPLPRGKMNERLHPRHHPSLFNAHGCFSSWKQNAWRWFDTDDCRGWCNDVTIGDVLCWEEKGRRVASYLAIVAKSHWLLCFCVFKDKDIYIDESY